MIEVGTIQEILLDDGPLRVGDEVRHKKGWTGTIVSMSVPVLGHSGSLNLIVKAHDRAEACRLSRAWPLAIKSKSPDGYAVYGCEIPITWRNFTRMTPTPQDRRE